PSLVSFCSHDDSRDLRSFPTRRSSDLSRTLEICEPMWKCSSLSASPMPASRSDFHRSSSCRGLRPNLALSPPEFCHLPAPSVARSEEHTSELQSRENLVCRLLLEKKKQ